jgi:transcriptional repressor NrdR
LNCPFCGYFDSKVIDSRDVNDGIRRRRQCLRCELRFTTYERLQPVSLFVIKKDGRREDFRREKLLTGIRKACEKRPLESGAVDKLVDEIEGELYQVGKAEVPGAVIGDMVMAKLKSLDHIAYIRFASVYREFADITELKQEVDSLAGHAITPPADQLPLIPPEVLPVAIKSKRRVRR